MPVYALLLEADDPRTAQLVMDSAPSNDALYLKT
jgi:hypothetical protein